MRTIDQQEVPVLHPYEEVRLRMAIKKLTKREREVIEVVHKQLLFESKAAFFRDTAEMVRFAKDRVRFRRDVIEKEVTALSKRWFKAKPTYSSLIHVSDLGLDDHGLYIGGEWCATTVQDIAFWIGDMSSESPSVQQAARMLYKEIVRVAKDQMRTVIFVGDMDLQYKIEVARHKFERPNRNCYQVVGDMVFDHYSDYCGCKLSDDYIAEAYEQIKEVLLKGKPRHVRRLVRKGIFANLDAAVVVASPNKNETPFIMAMIIV